MIHFIKKNNPEVFVFFIIIIIIRGYQQLFSGKTIKKIM